MTESNTKEARVRAKARRMGYIVKKSRSRDPRNVEYGGFMLIDAQTNSVVVGHAGWAYSATLEDIEHTLRN